MAKREVVRFEALDPTTLKMKVSRRMALPEVVVGLDPPARAIEGPKVYVDPSILDGNGMTPIDFRI